MCGYSTESAAPVAMAASTAEPPARSASPPAAEASECGEATMPLGAIVAGLPVCMGNTGGSTLRRTRQQAHHGGHARLHAEFFENVLEMLLHRARTHVENRADFHVGLAPRSPLQHLPLPRSESRPRDGCRKIRLDRQTDDEQKTAAARRVGNEPHAQRPSAPPDRERAARRGAGEIFRCFEAFLHPAIHDFREPRALA